MRLEPDVDLAERIDRRLGRLEKGVRALQQQLRARAPAARETTFAATTAEIDRVAAGGEKVIAGPWVGELGFELLYWIPFLAWAVERRPDLAGRLVAVSRGGARPWYAHLTGSYRDVYEAVTPEELIEGRGRRTKQVELTSFEERVLTRLEAGGDTALLHPAAMYAPLLALTRALDSSRFREIARYRRFDPPPLGTLEGVLPEEFAAVRFYFNNSFPDTAENRRLAAETVAALGRESAVVVLNTGLRLDDHSDLPAGTADRVLTLEGHTTPANNLAVQSAVIARARVFVGTYGGLSYLPSFYGVPSVSFYSDASQFLPHHLEFAQSVFREAELGDYLALDARQVGALRTVLR